MWSDHSSLLWTANDQYAIRSKSLDVIQSSGLDVLTLQGKVISQVHEIVARSSSPTGAGNDSSPEINTDLNQRDTLEFRNNIWISFNLQNSVLQSQLNATRDFFLLLGDDDDGYDSDYSPPPLVPSTQFDEVLEAIEEIIGESWKTHPLRNLRMVRGLDYHISNATPTSTSSSSRQVLRKYLRRIRTAKFAGRTLYEWASIHEEKRHGLSWSNLNFKKPWSKTGGLRRSSEMTEFAKNLLYIAKNDVKHILTTEGHIGVAHSRVENGDRIVKLEGLDDCILLRPVSRDTNQWRIVGGVAIYYNTPMKSGETISFEIL